NSALTGPLSVIPPGTYDVVVANGCGSVTSAPAVVTAVAPVRLPTQPASLAVCQGASFLFEFLSLVFGTNDFGPLTFQWRKDGTNIPGAHQFFYGKSEASTNDAGTYSCVI